MALSGGEVWEGEMQMRHREGPTGSRPGFLSGDGSGLENLSGVGWAPGPVMSVSGEMKKRHGSYKYL